MTTPACFSELEHSGWFHNQSRPETVDASSQSARQELHVSFSGLNKDANLNTTVMASVGPPVEDLMLITKPTDCPVCKTGEMSEFDLTPILKGFKLQKCLSPLESDDNDVPAQKPSRPSQEKRRPLRSKSSLELIDSSRGSRDQSRFEKQEPKISSHVSSADQTDVIGRRMTRRRLATLKASQEAQSRLSKTKRDQIKELKCGNGITTLPVCTQTSTPFNANRKTIAGAKRKQENCLPLSKKMCRKTRNKLKDDLPKVQVTAGIVKRGCGRPPKSESGQESNSAQKTGRAAHVLVKPNPNTQEKDSIKADVNGNLEQTKQNVHMKYSDQARRPSIIDQIFHQTSNAWRNSLLIGPQPTENPQYTACSTRRLQGPLEKSGKGSNLVNNLVTFGESKTGIFVLEETGALDNQVRSQSKTPLTVQCPVFQCHIQNDIQEQPNEISVTSGDLTKDVMDVDHAVSPAETDSRADDSKPEVMERIDKTRIVREMHTGVCINLEDLEKKTEAAVSSCLENNEEKDSGGCKVVQLMKDTVENEGGGMTDDSSNTGKSLNLQ